MRGFGGGISEASSRTGTMYLVARSQCWTPVGPIERTSNFARGTRIVDEQDSGSFAASAMFESKSPVCSWRPMRAL